MKKLLLVVVAFVAFTTATAQTCTPPQDYVEVRGTAYTMVMPNKAEISITLNQADSKGKLSMKELEDQLAKALKEAGVDTAKQLVIVNQSSEAEKRNKAYQFKSYILTVSSAAEAQTVFDAFANNGVNNATISKVWNDNQKEIVEKLKIEAMQDAQTTAKTLAAAVGQSIGKALQISDNSYTPTFAMMDSGFLARKTSNSGALESLPNLDFQKLKIERNVTVRFALN